MIHLRDPLFLQHVVTAHLVVSCSSSTLLSSTLLRSFNCKPQQQKAPSFNRRLSTIHLSHHRLNRLSRRRYRGYQRTIIALKQDNTHHANLQTDYNRPLLPFHLHNHRRSNLALRSMGILHHQRRKPHIHHLLRWMLQWSSLQLSTSCKSSTLSNGAQRPFVVSR